MNGADTFDGVLLTAMASALILAFVSRAVQNRFIASEPLLALASGELVGPVGLGWVQLMHLTVDVHALLEQAARLTLSVAILSATLRVGWRWTRRNPRDVAVILGLGMPLMYALSWLLLAVTLSLGAWPSLLVAAVVTPTDPVLAQSVVTSSTAEAGVPKNLRHLISLESAANDGLALPLVMIPILAMGGAATHFGSQLAHVVLWRIVAGLASGALFGWCVGRVLERLGERWITEAGGITVSTTLAFCTLAGASLLGMDGLFAVFGAGMGLSAALGDGAAPQQGFNETMARLFQLPTLTLLGLALPVAAWERMGWPLLGAVLAVLLLRRLPMVLLLRPVLRTARDWPSAVFLGWFGPIGIAALLYSVIAARRTGMEEYFTVGTGMIVGSVIAHGLSDTAGAHWLGRMR